MTRVAGRTEREIQGIALADGRHLRVNGTSNLRDIGGYPTDAGGSVAWRTLFRSDSLHKLGSQGVAGLAALGLRTIVDLRSDMEVEQRPGAVAGLLARVVHAPLVRDPALLPPLADLAAEYRYTIDECGDPIGAAVRELCAPGALPALVHCAAGQDRTGIVIALVLAVLGVPDELIAADYSLSFVYLDPGSTEVVGRLKATSARHDQIAELLKPGPLILTALARARSVGGGSVSGYLMAHGVGAPQLEALRSALAQ